MLNNLLSAKKKKVDDFHPLPATKGAKDDGADVLKVELRSLRGLFVAVPPHAHV